MSGIGYSAALVLAAVFVWAAVAKLRSPEATVAGFAGLRLPAAGFLSKAVPVAELALAAVLVTLPVWGAVAAVVLLGAFSVVLIANAGRAAGGCNCFGASPGDDQVTGVALVRNGLLAGTAVVVTAADGPAVPGFADVVVVATGTVLAVVGLAVMRFRQRAGRAWDNRLPGEAKRP